MKAAGVVQVSLVLPPSPLSLSLRIGWICRLVLIAGGSCGWILREGSLEEGPTPSGTGPLLPSRNGLLQKRQLS